MSKSHEILDKDTLGENNGPIFDLNCGEDPQSIQLILDQIGGDDTPARRYSISLCLKKNKSDVVNTILELV
jgi:hypothetical protein